MSKKNIVGFIWIIFSILLQTAAQAFGKQAALVSYGNSLFVMVLNRWYLLELVSLFCQALCWGMALRNFPLSFAYPFMSLVIGLNLLVSWFFFKESILLNHLVGVFVITMGIILVSRRIKT